MERLDKTLSAGSGLSRSQVKAVLKQGRVTVDGLTERDGSRKVDPERQVIALDAERIHQEPAQLVVMLNKPAGYVTARWDPSEPTVMELLPEELARRDLHPVGRLDKATEGLLLFTNDGELLHRLISPRSAVEKVYYAHHEGAAGEADVEAFRAGLTLGDGTQCLPAELEPLGPGESLITVREGKYHQVRRMMASRGMPVTYLERRREGCLELGALPRGKVRTLEGEELRSLLDSQSEG